MLTCHRQNPFASPAKELSARAIKYPDLNRVFHRALEGALPAVTSA
jgi:hypothetical protein